MSRLLLPPLLLGLLVLAGSGPVASAEMLPQAAPRMLRTTWNLVAAPETSPIDALVAGVPQIEAIYRWDAAAGTYDSWIRSAPAFLNSLAAVAAGDGLWVRVSAGVSWPLPAPAPTAVAADAAGWVLVGWTDDAIAASQAAAQLGATRLSGYDSNTQQFRIYDASLPDVLNTLNVLQRGDGVWAFMGAAAPGPIGLVAAFGGRVFDAPIEFGAYPAGRFFVADLGGRVLLITSDGTDAGELINLRPRLRQGGEEGLLSVALDPQFAQNGFLYAYYTPSGTEQTRLSRFTVTNDAAPLATELILLEVAQPFRNHNGGAVRFGPDGLLYLGLGDGGSGGDPLGHGQNTQSLLGSIIRIDVRGASAVQPYRVPPGNPFAGGGGRPEIWAYGLRNPWRMAFDPATGTLWAGDVGQNEIEEIDTIHGGGNYGWNRLEGNACFSPPQGCTSAGTVLPVATYGHDQGCSVTGGVVARDGPVGAIEGAYIYSDFCSGRIWALNAAAPATPAPIAEADANVVSFGVGPDGSVYVITFGGPILRIVDP